MSFSLLPKEVKFFDMFDQQVTVVRKAAVVFKELTANGKFSEDEVKKMRDIEHECDDITHDIINKLNRTFITPFDREDIHSLAHEIDSVVDILYSNTKRMRLYKIKKTNKDLVKFAEIIEQSVKCLAEAVNSLRNIKNPKKCTDACIEINKLENDGDQLLDTVLGKLMSGSGDDPLTIIKWKEIFESAETTLDVCEDVANIVESILVKQG